VLRVHRLFARLLEQLLEVLRADAVVATHGRDGSADVLTGQTEVNTVPFPEGLVLGGPGSYDRSMNPALQDRSTELSTLCRRHHVRSLSVFGSAARGEMRADSDVASTPESTAGRRFR
jgi:hypothetical protein